MAKLVQGSTCKVPMSNISYVSEDVFTKQVEELKATYDVSVIWINHKGEGDKKDHRHYLLKSNGSGFSNVTKIKQIMFEYDTDGSVIDGKMFAQCKSLGDYYEYILHDPDYLSSKGEKRQFTYAPDDIKGDKNLISDCLFCAQQLKNETTETDLITVSELVMQGANDFEILTKFKDNLSITDIGYAVNSIKKVRTALGGESVNLFYRQMAQMVNSRLTANKQVALEKIDLLVSGSTADVCQKMEILFNAFIDKLDNKIFDLLLDF